jgi:hypothetical protein
MDPYKTALMHRLVWIHAGRKPIMLVLSLSVQILNKRTIQQEFDHCKVPKIMLKEKLILLEVQPLIFAKRQINRI